MGATYHKFYGIESFSNFSHRLTDMYQSIYGRISGFFASLYSRSSVPSELTLSEYQRTDTPLEYLLNSGLVKNVEKADDSAIFQEHGVIGMINDGSVELLIPMHKDNYLKRIGRAKTDTRLYTFYTFDEDNVIVSIPPNSYKSFDGRLPQFNLNELTSVFIPSPQGKYWGEIVQNAYRLMQEDGVIHIDFIDDKKS